MSGLPFALRVLSLYAQGTFPMAQSRDDGDLHVIDPKVRGILPLDGFHISRSLARRLRRGEFTATTDTAFEEVVTLCADRDETWINATLREVYTTAHRLGRAHSLEVWQDGRLVGGTFGISQGGAFFAESMFSKKTDASKAALAWLVQRLTTRGYTLCDTQFLTPHLASLGGIEITRTAFRERLALALSLDVSFGPAGRLCPAASLLGQPTR
ncbi:leucyl/phenylalanyl-tRNA--protein transferase [Frigidibacter sp. MR17.24]|uniref:leucyl/phenylalanyl-tRNA--protein transferase n=1 Tax=Frigidibacter sp. MR17.24 TaxID=3127345 RepID=UPI003012CC97